LAVVSPMDSLFAYEAAFPVFTTFFDRYYLPGPNLEKIVPNNQEISKRAFDGSFFYFILFYF